MPHLRPLLLDPGLRRSLKSTATGPTVVQEAIGRGSRCAADQRGGSPRPRGHSAAGDEVVNLALTRLSLQSGRSDGENYDAAPPASALLFGRSLAGNGSESHRRVTAMLGRSQHEAVLPRVGDAHVSLHAAACERDVGERTPCTVYHLFAYLP
jgi:hypothetical protein